MMILQWIAVFVATLLADICWARYSMSVAAHSRTRASIWSALIVVCGSTAVVEYTTNHWLISAAICGAFTGTWIAMRKAKEAA